MCKPGIAVLGTDTVMLILRDELPWTWREEGTLIHESETFEKPVISIWTSRGSANPVRTSSLKIANKMPSQSSSQGSVALVSD